MKNKSLILILLLFVLFSYSQDKNTDVFVLGIIEIEDPVLVYFPPDKECNKRRLVRMQRTWNHLITSKKNINTIVEHKSKAQYLIYDSNYYMRPTITSNRMVYEHIYPLCNDSIKRLIRYMYSSRLYKKEERIGLFPPNSKMINVNEKVRYISLYSNKFLLVLVNYKYYSSYLYYWEWNPPIVTPCFEQMDKLKQGIYIKVLIPLVDIESENEEEWW